MTLLKAMIAIFLISIFIYSINQIATIGIKTIAEQIWYGKAQDLAHDPINH